MESRPELPTDPRWKPERTVLILAAVVQILLIGSAIWYSETSPATPIDTTRRLVPEVIVPEDVVFRDTEIAARKGREIPPVDVRQAATPSPEALNEGTRLYSEHCRLCHGPGGRGDGPAGTTLKPPPRDLTRLSGWRNGTRLSGIFRSLTLGIPSTSMPAFDYLTHQQRFAISHFVRSLAAGHEQDTDTSLASLDKEFSLSQGAREPSVIPVSTALERVLAESSGEPEYRALTGNDSPTASLLESLEEPDGRSRLNRILSSDTTWHQDIERFRNLICLDPAAAGVKPRVRFLSDEEWQKLHALLRELLVE
ncbi:MAG TPA: cytochrome c [Acidobacteriota bacterium]|nr:cytochrome c [Acidobacteriota bacterium]